MNKITNLINNTNFALNYYFVRDKIEYKIHNLSINQFCGTPGLHSKQGLYIIYDNRHDEIWYVGYTQREGFWKRIKKHIDSANGNKQESTGIWACCSRWIETNNYDFINNCSVFLVETTFCNQSLLKHIETGLIYELQPLANKECFSWEKVSAFTSKKPDILRHESG